MTRPIPARLPFAGAAFLVALSGALMGSPAAVEAQDYYTDIRPILVQNCMGCHSEDGISWSMEDPEETYGRASRIARAVDSGQMPPWLAEPGHQEYVGDLSLDEETVAVVRRWAANGYEMGEPRPDPVMAEAEAMMAHNAFSPDVGVDVLPAEGYLPNQEWTDDYRCFLADWPETESGFVNGFRALVGNRGVGHHLVVFSVEPEMWERYKEVDEMYGDGPGYTCFGGTLPDQLVRRENRAAYEERYPDGVRELARASSWLAHWAPGMNGHVFPEGTGVEVRPGSGLVVQMHYYASAAPGERDADTRMEFMTTADVENPALNFDQTRGDWLGGERNETMVIQPGEMKSYEMEVNLENALNYFARRAGVPAERVQALQIHSANLHMHAHGHSGEVTLRHHTGWSETLLSIPEWDLGWQRDFEFTEPKIIPREALEDTALRVECTYLNETDEVVYGGYGSFDEMCFNFSYISVVEGDAPVTTEGGGARPEER